MLFKSVMLFSAGYNVQVTEEALSVWMCMHTDGVNMLTNKLTMHQYTDEHVYRQRTNILMNMYTDSA